MRIVALLVMETLMTILSMEEILKHYAALLREVDAWFDRCLSLAVGDISCKAGCSACCRGLFDITLLDACYLKRGFDRLEPDVRKRVTDRAEERLVRIREVWPDFTSPYILNFRPDDQWDQVMPDDEMTPCPLLGEEGRCLVYDHRPMTCRLHGLPLMDVGGEVVNDEWCTLNFTAGDPLNRDELKFEFVRLFKDELSLFRMFTMQLLNRRLNELDTVIPTALLMDFDRFDWPLWVQNAYPSIVNNN